MAEIDNIIESSIDLATGQVRKQYDLLMGGGPGFIDAVHWLSEANNNAPPWWSPGRDVYLGRVWRTSNHLAAAIYNAQAKIVGIPPQVVPRDPSNPRHVRQAEELTQTILLTSGFGQTWYYAYAQFIEDVLCQDNGGFMEIIGDGPAAGPIIGTPISVRHLDSRHCQRTGDPVYPVLYRDVDSALYKFHRSRIIYYSQMASPRREMNGVGFCAVSRCVDVAQTLVDMVLYKQQRLGSRPQNQILVGKGITGKQIMQALVGLKHELDAKGQNLYGGTAALGSEMTDIGIDKIDLNHMDPFDEETATSFAMYIIAAAIGMDADELWPVASSGGSKSDADLRRARARGRLPSQITGEVAKQLSTKMAPPHLKIHFDFRDDAEDQQKAVVRDIRGRNRERDLGTGAITPRTARLNMVGDGDITQDEFEEMELEDGRLGDGSPISLLFYSDDPLIKDVLDFEPSPLSIEENIGGDTMDDSKLRRMIVKIQQQKSLALSFWATHSPGTTKYRKYRWVYHALDWLEERYLFAAGKLLPPVPMQGRRMRTDIRVLPEETSPVGVSPAGAAQVQDENIPEVQ